MTDKELAALLERDPEAGMETVMAAYTGLLWKVASGLLQSREDIQDCVSETFSEFYLHRENYDPEQGTLGGYLAVIARRRAAAIYRKSSRELCPPGSGPDPDSLIEDSDWLEKLEQSMIVDQAVAGLDEASQKIIRMKYYEGLSTREIAESLNVPYETVKKRHTRSMKKLRKLLLTLLIIAILLFLAACGVIYVLRHLGVLPGYGVTTDPDAFCCLMEERTPTVEAEGYTAWIESAKLYDGVLETQLHIDLPEQPYEWYYIDGTAKVPVHPLEFNSVFCWEGGAPLPGKPTAFSGGSGLDFHVEWHLSWILGRDALDALRQEGRMALELRVTDISFDGKEFPDAVIPFTLAEVQQQPLENYPSFYDETAGGFLLDSHMEDGVLRMDVYSLSNGTMEFFSGLSLDPLYHASVFEDSALPVIRGEDGTLYTGEAVHDDCPIDSSYSKKFTTFLFPDAPPGKYTLTIPHSYVMVPLDKPGQLTWDLKNCTFSNDALEYPGVRIYTVSIEETGPDPETLDLGRTRGWSIVVGVELENEAMRPVRAFCYPRFPDKLSYEISDFFSKVQYFFIGGDSLLHDCGSYTGSGGEPAEEDGTLLYHVEVDERAYQVLDLTQVELRPEYDMGGPLVILYDQPIELEFEVTP